MPAQLFYGCNSVNNNEIDVNQLLKDHRLVLEDGIDFVQNDSIRISLYSNRETDKALLILRNTKNDTIVKYFGNGIASISMFQLEAKNRSLFLLIPHSDGTSYKRNRFGRKMIDIPRYKEGEIYLDSLYCFEVLTSKNNLKKIPRISNDSLIKRAKKEFLLKGDFKMMNAPRTDSFIIEKDSIDNKVCRYLIITDNYIPKKSGEGFVLSPLNFRLSYLGLYKDSVTIKVNPFGSTLNDTLSTIGSRINRFSVYEKNYFKFSNNGYHEQLFKKEIWLSDNLNETEKILLEIDKANFTLRSSQTNKQKIKGDIVDVEPVMFKLRNGEYFILLFIPHEGEYPQIYQLDTLQWKMNALFPYDLVRHQKFRILSNQNNVEMVSDEVGTRISSFLEHYNIVQVGNELKLKQKM